MGRELKRVALDFDHPLEQRWPGFINPWYDHCGDCDSCHGTGYSEEAHSFSRTLLDPRGRFEKVREHCEAMGLAHLCAECKGDGTTFDTPEAAAAAEAWERTDPPAGEGYQMWETVSEGSPISPVFATPEELAHYLAGRPWGADYGSSYDSWLRMILSDGWAPSFGIAGGALKSGVELVHGVEPC